MGEVSISRALGAGFGLFRRHPGAFVVWTLVYIVIGVLPQVGIMALMAPSYTKMMQGAVAGPGSLNVQAMQTQMQVLQIAPLGWLLSILCLALLLGAAYRAVLFPEDKGFFYLRLGLRELWLALVSLVLMIGFVVVMFAIMLPIGLIGGIAGAAAGSGGAAAAALFVFVAMVAGFAVLIWLALRMSLAPPMTFAEKQFRLFESWEATRGQAARMFGAAAAIIGLMFVAETVIGLVALFAGGGLSALASLAQTGDPGEVMARMAPISAIAGLALSPFAAAFYVLFGGAWAQMYRDIFPATEDVFS